MKSGNVLLAIDDQKRAIGYLAWEKDPTSNQSITFTHQSAPFGDHLELFERFKKQFPEIEVAKSRNARSAREEQIAWQI